MISSSSTVRLRFPKAFALSPAGAPDGPPAFACLSATWSSLTPRCGCGVDGVVPLTLILLLLGLLRGLLLDEAGGVGKFGGNVEFVRLGPGLGIEISVGADS